MDRRGRMSMDRCRVAVIWLCAAISGGLLISLTAGVSSAQRQFCQPVIPRILPDIEEDEFHVLVPPRGKLEIKRDLEDAHAAAFSAEADLQRCRDLQAEAKAQISVWKSEISTLKARIKLAKERKHEADRLDLEQQKKTVELELKRFESRREMRGAERELAEAVQEAAEARAHIHERELDLSAQKAELASLRTTAKVGAFVDMIVRFERGIRELELSILHGMKDLAGRQGTVAKRERALIESRIELSEIQAKVRAGAGG